MDKYQLILADPPWQCKDQGTRLSPSYNGKQRKSGVRYDTMTLQEICELGEWVRWLAADTAILLMWSIHAIKETHPWPVIKAWGFRYSTAIPWVKARWDAKKQRFVYNIGGGHTVRSCSEELLVCTKGKAASKLVKDRGVPGAIIAPASRVHSRKPVEQYLIAERLVKGPYLELFARERRPGWDAYGNEL
ncbi:MT-A70 family methyltransferase [Desulforamulus aquiferis]|uniref:MT-A70 family methyltransferase n=1 Tax=Desulforamulus aquiferis TaxID=1397668 RepID=A0AAW7ZH86_9FIRM|nr:MT-A70 family methyltransferase [Desulforamulus aquiferis]MDO7789139.1 MT-A70 family methyltransferase [Desulforamulus aquiferis]